MAESTGLLSMKTNLKDLRFSSMPLGSDAPYVNKDIGYSPNSSLGLEASKRLDDVSRISKMLKDRPGIKYLLHEAELQQTNIGDTISKATKGSKTLTGALIQQVKDTVINTAKLAGSTLAQVAVDGTGTHFIKGFEANTYLKQTNTLNTNGAGGNPVYGSQNAINGTPIIGSTTSIFYNGKEVEASSYDYNRSGVDTYKPDETPNKTLTESQEAGIRPSGSVVTTGGVQTTKKPGYLGSLPNTEPTPAQITGSYKPYKGSDLDDLINTTYIPNTTVSDFRVGSETSYSFNYSSGSINKETRVGLGNQGIKKAPGIKYSTKIEDAIDIVNAIDVAKGKGKANMKGEGRDMAKFYFEVITPTESTFVHFRAFIDSVDDGYNATWNGTKYVGRAEDFFTYGGFSRDINVSFKIAAATRSEMRPLYRKMVYLASTTAPTYTSGFMQGTIVRMTLGSYFDEIPGVITSVKYTINSESPWEIALQNPENGTDDDVQELPMVLNCSISFKPIHDFAPRTGLFHYITAKSSNDKSVPFI